jgi:formylglycine-generating enzyme required for sulfatase activity
MPEPTSLFSCGTGDGRQRIEPPPSHWIMAAFPSAVNVFRSSLEKEADRMRQLFRRFAAILILGALASCATGPIGDLPREEYSILGQSFAMMRIPAVDFPGGKLGTVLLTEERPKIIGPKADFLLAETNTTFALWKAVRDRAAARGYTFNRPGQMGTQADGDGMDGRHPVTVVDWVSAAIWCNSLTELFNEETGAALAPVYEHEGRVLRGNAARMDAGSIVARPGADGFRLPTGLEWELAARYSSERLGEDYAEYPKFSGRYWASFLQVSGEIESKAGPIGSEGRNAVSRPVLELDRNALGFTGFAGDDGKLWQWCYEFLRHDGRDAFSLKRGGSRGPRCGRHDDWPKTKWGYTCTGYDQITFRVARNAR